MPMTQPPQINTLTTTSVEHARTVAGPVEITEGTGPLVEPLPFSMDEYARRLEALRADMALTDLDAFIAFGPENINYLTGHDTPAYQYLQACIVTHEGSPVNLLRSIDASNTLLRSWSRRSVAYANHDDPVAVLVALMSQLVPLGARIGAEDRAFFVTPRRYRQLKEALDSCRLCPGWSTSRRGTSADQVGRGDGENPIGGPDHDARDAGRDRDFGGGCERECHCCRGLGRARKARWRVFGPAAVHCQQSALEPWACHLERAAFGKERCIELRDPWRCRPIRRAPVPHGFGRQACTRDARDRVGLPFIARSPV